MLDSLKSLNPNGTPPETRIARAGDAYQIWNQLRMADAVSSYERSRIAAMYDNVPPLDQKQLDANGQSYRANVSWGLAPMVLEMAQSGYLDILESTDSFFECPTELDLPPEQRHEVEQIIAEEVSNCMRSWEDFPAQYQRNTSTFIKYGVSFVTFDDEWDWRFDSKGMSDVKIPRKTKVGQNNIDVASWLRFYSASQLYQFIKDPEVAKANGWNIEAVKKAILNAVNNANTFTQNMAWDWEKLEIELRNNDYYWTYGIAQTQNIRIVHMVWQEFSGRYSYGIICDDQTVSQDWLCHKVDRFSSSHNCFIAYTYGVGNDYYHGIRGQGQTIFPIVGALNRSYNQLLELGTFGSAPVLQPKDESAAQEMQFTPMGIYNLVSPGITVLPGTIVPNLSQGVLPMLNSFSQMFREQTSNANNQSLMDSTKEMTAAEVNARLASVSKMSISSHSLFYPPHECTLREMVRRMIRKDYSELEPGGSYIVELRKKLLKRGGNIILEAFYKLDTTRLRAKRSIGSGSEAARLLAFNQLMQIIQYLPESGRQNVIRDFVAGYVTYRNADRYTSPGTSPALTNQEGVAWTQNALLTSGQFQPVLPNEDLFVHARVHAEVLPGFTEQTDMAVAQAAEIVGSGQPLDLNPVLAQLQALQLFTEHFAETTQRIAVNPMGQKLVAQYKQILQQSDEVTNNGLQQIQALMERQAEQAAQAGPQEPQVDPAKIADIENKRAITEEKIESIRATTAAKIEAQQLQTEQKLAINDVENAQQLRQKAQEGAIKRRQTRRRP